MIKLLHLLNIQKTQRKRCGFPQKRNIYHLSSEKVNNQYLDISDGLYEYVGLPKGCLRRQFEWQLWQKSLYNPPDLSLCFWTGLMSTRGSSYQRHLLRDT